MAVSFIAKKNNLRIDYSLVPEFASMGIDFFSGKNVYHEVLPIHDSNFFSLIQGPPVYKNIVVSGPMHCQTRDFTVFLSDYFSSKEIQQKIIDSNQFKQRYGKNEEVFVHVRLGDVPQFNPGFEFFDCALAQAKIFPGFTGGYVSSDSIDDPICRRLMKKYNLQKWVANEVDTIKMASTSKILVLSNGTFSWFMGLLGFFTEAVYYPKVHRVWHGDIYVNDRWIELDPRSLPKHSLFNNSVSKSLSSTPPRPSLCKGECTKVQDSL
jgi:hypothetical protein